MADNDRVELTELDVITRFSLAVRTATADRDEVIAALRSDLAWLEGGRPRSTAASPAPRRAPAARTGTTRTATTRASSSRAAAKKSTARTAKPAKKAAGRRRG